MQKNMGGIDRIIRIVIAIALFAHIANTGDMEYLQMMLEAGGGMILLITALIGWCPIYKLLGINSSKVRAV